MTEPLQERRDPPAKNRVVGSRHFAANRVEQNEPQPLETVSETSVTITVTVSGIPCWPSRDPIGEDGGANLYGFVDNNANEQTDYLGMALNDPPDSVSYSCCEGSIYDPQTHCCNDETIVERVEESITVQCLYYYNRSHLPGGRQPIVTLPGGVRVSVLSPWHCWVEFMGVARGFYPGIAPGERGRVDDDGGRPEVGRLPNGQGFVDVVEESVLNNCDDDFDSVTDCISNRSFTLPYNRIFNNCQHWAGRTFSACRNAGAQ